MLINVRAYPHIIRAVNEIRADQGFRDAITDVHLKNWDSSTSLDRVEAVLRDLTDEDFENFCCGMEEDIEEIATRSKDHTLADSFLRDFFNTL